MSTELFSYLSIAMLTLIGFILYRFIAVKLNLLDIPNERSSHSTPTYRGAGVIFLIAYLGSLFFLGPQDIKLTLAIFLATAVGFWDDYKGLSAGLRATLYLTALVLALFSIPGFERFPWGYIVLTIIVGLGTMNAYNFMDGINGISTVYFLTMIGSIYYFHHDMVWYPDHLISALAIAALIFLVLNLRKRAIAFMGDAGSVALGMISVYLVVLLIWKTNEAAWLLLFLIYGVDSVLTIAERLLRKENIFKAHRRHLYQLLSNEMGWSHVAVAVLYGILQIIVNIALAFSLANDMHTLTVLLLFAGISGVLYIAVKIFLVRKLEASNREK